MGIIFKAQGKLDDAVLAYKNTLSLEPDHANAYINLSIIFCQQGKIDKAIESLPNHSNKRRTAKGSLARNIIFRRH